MKKEFIMTEEEKRVKKLKTEIGKGAVSRKDSVISSGAITEDSDPGEMSFQMVDNEQNSGQYGLENELNFFDAFPAYSFQQHFNMAVDEFYRLDDAEMMTDVPTMEELTKSFAQQPSSPEKPKIEFKPTLERIAEAEFSPTPIRKHYEATSNGQRDLNELEISKLQELLEANEELRRPAKSESEAPFCIRNPSLIDIVKITDHAIRKFITMAKRVSSFKSLCEEDQIALLKGCCAELMVLRSVMSYNTLEDCWTDGDERCVMKMSVLKQAKGNLYEEHRKFINSFKPAWRKDERVMLLLGAIALFSPERHRVVHHTAIRCDTRDTFVMRCRIMSVVKSF